MGCCSSKRLKTDDPNGLLPSEEQPPKLPKMKPPSKPKGGPPKPKHPNADSKTKEKYGSSIKQRVNSMQRDLAKEERKRKDAELARRRSEERQMQEDQDLLAIEEEELRALSEKKRTRRELKKGVQFSLSEKAETRLNDSPKRLSRETESPLLRQSKGTEDSPKITGKFTESPARKERKIEDSPIIQKKFAEDSTKSIVALESPESSPESSPSTTRHIASSHSQIEDDEPATVQSVVVEESRPREAKEVESQILVPSIHLKQFVELEGHTTDEEDDKSSEEEEKPQEMESYKILKAMYTYKARNDQELSFALNDEIAHLNEEYGGWWRGQNLNTLECGWFPSNYIQDTGKTRDLPKVSKQYEPQELEQQEEEEKNTTVIRKATKKVSSSIRALQQKLAKSKTKNALFTKLGLTDSMDETQMQDDDDDDDDDS
ncbi:neurofilament heavy polypeptide [Planoprotostelium fungivorum]|uniref:Neurofilament heavy polypeptide n=1 Tax=Planoprotostelium fungivorum TaxID=1890364 RepID=A0A2P6NYI5_9EUKA|nr:neurofilament heavy polypeptide [Planoprotostelium fungivorum]